MHQPWKLKPMLQLQPLQKLKLKEKARAAVGMMSAVMLAWLGRAAAVDQVLHNTTTAYVAGAATFDERLGGSSACVVAVKLMLLAGFAGAGCGDGVGTAFPTFSSASFLGLWQVKDEVDEAFMV
jgi:hypothetical protein